MLGVLPTDADSLIYNTSQFHQAFAETTSSLFKPSGSLVFTLRGFTSPRAIKIDLIMMCSFMRFEMVEL